MRVVQALTLGASLLPRRAGLPDPSREARWLLAAAMGVGESWLFAHPRRDVPAPDLTRYRDWLESRADGAPAHHLTGVCTFWGRDFAVSPAALIPRPETELLVAQALALPVSGAARVLDVGTGSGCIGVTLAAERVGWMIAATDVSSRALEVARRNVDRHRVAVRLVLADLAAACGGGWDLVVANLPYLPNRVISELPIEVRREPRRALDGGADGLELVRRLVVDLPRLLARGGRALLELGEDQAAAVVELTVRAGLVPEASGKDLSGCERWVQLRRDA